MSVRLSAITEDPHALRDIGESQVGELMEQVTKVLPDLSVSSTRGHLPLVSPDQLEERLAAIRTFHRHLLPLARRQCPSRCLPCLTLTLENCHCLVLQALAASAQGNARGQHEDAGEALSVPRAVLDSLNCVVDQLNSGEREEVRTWLSAPKTILRVLVAVFQHFLQCSEASPPFPQGYQGRLRELFEECKRIMIGLEEALGRGGRMDCGDNDDDDDDEEENLQDVVHLLADLVRALPRLDSRFFVRMARLFAEVSGRRRDLARTGRFGCRAREVLSTTAGLALEQVEAVRRLAASLAGGGGATSTTSHERVRRLEQHSRKLELLLRLAKDLCDIFCDELGSDFSVLVRAVSKALSLNDASVEFAEALSVEVRQTVTSGLTSLSKAALEELMIDQNFASFVFGKEFSAPEPPDGCTYELCHACAYLLHRLPHKNDGTRKLWMESKEKNLFLKVLVLAGSSDHFNSDSLVIGVEHSGRGTQAVTPYEHVITLMQSFVMGASPREMELVEETLMTLLLTKQPFWTLKFVSDVWCFIGRFGPAEYCCSHTTRLFELLLLLPPEHPSREAVAHVASRMSAFLSESGTRELERLLDDFDKATTSPDDGRALLAAVASARVDRLGESFKCRALEHCVSRLRGLSAGDAACVDRAADSLVVLEMLRPELRPDSVKVVRGLVADVWHKLASGIYVPSSSEWCNRLLEALFRLTSVLESGYQARERTSLIDAMWSVVTSSAYDPTLCFLAAEFLARLSEPPPSGEANFWRDLLLAAGPDALLEWRCLLLLRRFRFQQSTLKQFDAELVGEAMAGKLAKTFHEASHAPGDSRDQGVGVDLEKILSEDLAVAFAEVSKKSKQGQDRGGKRAHAGERDKVEKLKKTVGDAIQQAENLRGGERVSRELEKISDLLDEVGT